MKDPERNNKLKLNDHVHGPAIGPFTKQEADTFAVVRTTYAFGDGRADVQCY